MSLYQVQKLIYDVNRSDTAKRDFKLDLAAMLDNYRLTPEEATAVHNNDIGLLYVMGVNGQLLMHFATWRGLTWDKYIDAMRVGLKTHGPVRAGVYAAFEDRRI